MPPEPAVRAAHRPSRRAQIVEAAISVFGAEGPAVPIALVARAAMVTPAAIYYHFPSKEALFTEAVALVAERHLALTRGAEDRDPAAFSMAGAVELVWKWAEDNPEPARLLYVWSGEGPDSARGVRAEFVRDYIHRVIRRIERGPVAVDDVRHAEDELAARAYLQLAMSVSEEWASGRYRYGGLDRGHIVHALASVSQALTTIE
ncbi:TetR/AcrR family transcriptional regulator [Microbacterium sp. zg.B48]|uniref:TetR/AcrR family transcriptional regulator n=1 Tax=Microbacterium sp. zg.B48 TaxID=2969408 RepID=UPI00214C71B7|nr:TetR/AcrR family transcriptional regulator [Microbacterium sp. zg.B48]MCR2764330.1 TetR/AcrR family transcriptional regulator [Microbacterium sp. zg.B48]